MNNDNINLDIKLATEEATKSMKSAKKEAGHLETQIDKLTDSIDNLSEIIDNNKKKSEELENQNKKTFDIKKAGAWLLSIKKITEHMINLTEAQVTYNKAMQKLQVAYGSVNSSGEKLVKTMADLSGLNIAELTSSLGTFRQFASSLGLASDKASLLSENMLKMVNDLSSFYGLETEEMSHKLISALTGCQKYGK